MNMIENEKEKRSEKEEFEEQLLLLYRDLKRFVFTLTKNVDVMEDIVQTTTAIALEHKEQLRSMKAIKSWLFQIAKNEVNRYYREKGKHPESSYEEYQEIWEIKNAVDSIETEIFDIITETENQKMLLEAMKQLNEKSRQIVHLYYYRNMSLKEIAETLNMNYNTVTTIHTRALIKLRNNLSKEKEGAF